MISCHHYCTEVDNGKGTVLFILAELLKKKEASCTASSSANGIVQQLTPPYTPQNNGVSERRNRTLLDMVWGCEALVKRDTPDKLEQRSVKCIFIGYPKEMMGYYFYFQPENKIVVARFVEFFEKRLISQEISERAVDIEEIQEEEDTTPSEITSNIPQEVEGFEPPQEEVIPIQMRKKFGLEDFKPMKIPMSSDTKLTKDEESEFMDSTKYREDPKMSHLECLRNLNKKTKLMKTPTSSDTKLTKDEESESVDSTKYREDPKMLHLKAVKRIFRYIKGTMHLGLWYPKGTGIETIVYADSDHAGDYVDQKSLVVSIRSLGLA
ncbi:retrotransposon protein, putative, ty1-copia subclass [Tanacetum coccineum]